MCPSSGSQFSPLQFVAVKQSRLFHTAYIHIWYTIQWIGLRGVSQFLRALRHAATSWHQNSGMTTAVEDWQCAKVSALNGSLGRHPPPYPLLEINTSPRCWVSRSMEQPDAEMFLNVWLQGERNRKASLTQSAVTMDGGGGLGSTERERGERERETPQ